MKRTKMYKCHYCKEFVQPDELIEWKSESGKTKYRGHKSCRQEIINRSNLFEYYSKAIGLPSADMDFVRNCDKLKKDGYSYNIIMHAFKTKELDIIKNYDKGTKYIMAILRNQLNASYKQLSKVPQKTIHNHDDFLIPEEIEYISRKNTNDISDIIL